MLTKLAAIATALIAAACVDITIFETAQLDAGAALIVDAEHDASSDAGTAYPADARHSPMTAEVVARMREVLAKGHGNPAIFAKVGDSITARPSFLACFNGSDINLGAHSDLDSAHDYFRATNLPDGSTSFDRVSLAARNGLFTSDALPLVPLELDAMNPAFAVVMLGTNDAAPDAPMVATPPATYAASLRAVLEALMSRGVVPLVSTIPPRGTMAANALVGPINDKIRAVAEALQVPLMDYHATLLALPAYGLDAYGLHPVPYLDHPCWLTVEALAVGGINQRNLITLEALDRARRFIVDGEKPE